MEWFDLHQTTDAEFDQVKAMKWVSWGLSYFYYIIAIG
jgi:hypothetical protein